MPNVKILAELKTFVLLLWLFPDHQSAHQLGARLEVQL
jgi:hypothetical protein